LWVAFGLANAYPAVSIALGGSVHLQLIVPTAIGDAIWVALIYFVSKGRYWARLIYAVLLAVRTVLYILAAPAVWQRSEVLILMTASSLMCEYMAIYWLFTEPGRRWFKR
jgi:hypothetical protein